MLEIGFATSLHLSFDYLVLITLAAGKPQHSKIVTSSSSETFCETTCALDQNIFYWTERHCDSFWGRNQL